MKSWSDKRGPFGVAHPITVIPRDEGFRKVSVRQEKLAVSSRWKALGSECCGAEGDDRREAYTAIVWGGLLSHESYKFADADF